MSRSIFISGLFGMFFALSCVEEPEPEQNVISSEVPDDRLAFYVIEGLSDELMYKPLPIDSIKFFGECFIHYEEIVSYDTIYFSFKLAWIAINRIAGINNKYSKWCLPFAVVCEGEVIFGAYLYHPQSSCFPYWFYSTAIRQDQFIIYAPIWTESPLKLDPRKDPRMIKVLQEDGKIDSNLKDQ